MDQARDELIIAWGLWVGGVEPDRDPIVSLAVDALVAGLDSPALCELAGLPRHASWDEVDRLVHQSAAELGLPRPSDNGAMQTELLRLAHQILAGDLFPATSAGGVVDRLAGEQTGDGGMAGGECAACLARTGRVGW